MRFRRFRQVASVATALAIATVAIAACGGGDDGPEVVRSYDVELRVDDSADDYQYVYVDSSITEAGVLPDFTVGDEVTFHVSNTGQFPHDLQVQAPDGDIVSVASAVNPGDSLELTAYLGQTGIYRLNCLFDNHLTQHHMQTAIQVAARPT